MVKTDKIGRFAIISGFLLLMAVPLAYAQSGSVFIKREQKAGDSVDRTESSRPSIFIRPGQNKGPKRPFVAPHKLVDDSPSGTTTSVRFSGEKLVMPNMDMRGDETPTKQDLLMMVAASRQGDLEVIERYSALQMQKTEQERALRRQDERTNKALSKADDRKQERARKEEAAKQAKQKRKKKQVFVKKDRNQSDKPARIFNAYD